MMWLFEDKETRKIKKIVYRVANFVINDLKDKGLVSLYIAGTILSKEERTPKSDIDLFGLVSSDFKFKSETEINAKLEKLRSSICGGYEARFRGVLISAFEGGKQEGIVKFMRPERLIQRFMFFKHFWGKKFNFMKDFSVKPMELKDEASYLMGFLTNSIKSLRAGKETFPSQDFPKHVFELVRVEAQLFHNFKYHPARKKLVRHLASENNHIVHRAMALREKVPTRKQVLIFGNEVEEYIKKLKKLIK